MYVIGKFVPVEGHIEEPYERELFAQLVFVVAVVGVEHESANFGVTVGFKTKLEGAVGEAGVDGGAVFAFPRNFKKKVRASLRSVFSVDHGGSDHFLVFHVFQNKNVGVVLPSSIEIGKGIYGDADFFLEQTLVGGQIDKGEHLTQLKKIVNIGDLSGS